MLQHIHIRDLIIVHSLELELASGMTALTGETGAGKSILIDALGLALGAKADKGMIRAGCDRGEVTAVFQIKQHIQLQCWLTSRELDAEDECMVRRVLLGNGRSRAFINGSPVTIQTLKTLGELLVDIHGQHEHQSLLKPAAQRELLDAYAGHPELLKQVADYHKSWQQSAKHLASLRARADERAQRLDYLQFQLDELAQLNLAADELNQLEQEQTRLAHSDQLATDSMALNQLLYEAEGAVQPSLAKALGMVDKLAKLDPTLQETSEMLDSARIQVEEAAALLRQYADSVELDPQKLQAIDNRLASILQMARKHRIPAEQLPAHQARLQQETAELESADQALDELNDEVAQQAAAYAQAASKLSASRQQAAVKLSRTVTGGMQELGLKGGTFSIALQTGETDQGSSHGIDQCSFQVSANPGQPMAALAKVASGGELSRISLAIQVATANCGTVPTLIFDEVDVGIGGAIAEIVGKLLHQVGKERQVLCVTHLPQVASQAHHQLLVEKSTDGKTTQTRISTLDGDARIQEVARMLGGQTITEHTLAHASEMISQAHLPQEPVQE
jgi:DNA repair protein RecN (Recombination protein N)